MSWEENVRRVEPYAAGEQPRKSHMIKLNTNENPYPPAPGIEKAARDMKFEDFRLYPDMNSSKLVNSLADYCQVKPEQIFAGVGSDDVISLCFMTFFQSDKPILFPNITYSFYEVWAKLHKVPYRTCPLGEEFRICKEDYLTDNGGIIFPNPNAPTGVLERVDMIEEIIKANPNSVVIIDEAYIDFGGKSCISLIDKYDNLLVVQTFSKSRAMAGIRIGFAIASKKLIDYLKDVKFSFNSYTLNLPAIELGAAALADDEYFRETVDKIINTRERMKKEMAELGFGFTDSQSNFLFASHKRVPAVEIYQVLKENDIYVRYWNKPGISNYLRITIGTDEEMNETLAFLREYLVKRS